MINSQTIKYWDSVNKKYDKNWNKTKARIEISDREKQFISKYMLKRQAKKILDVGVGTGRIIDELIKSSRADSKISGIDISDEMIKFCVEKYKNNSKIERLIHADIQTSELGEKYDFITAVRIIKYTKDWKEGILGIKNLLGSGGVLIFTMPNLLSLNYFHKGPLALQRVRVNALRRFLEENNFEIMEIISFSKLPDILYDARFGNNFLYSKLIFTIENLLNLIIGKVAFGRVLFVAAKLK